MPRFTIDVGEKFDALLNGLAESEKTTKAEVVRRAVAYYAFLREQTDHGTNGRKVSITDKEDRVLKDVVLP